MIIFRLEDLVAHASKVKEFHFRAIVIKEWIGWGGFSAPGMITPFPADQHIYNILYYYFAVYSIQSNPVFVLTGRITHAMHLFFPLQFPLKKMKMLATLLFFACFWGRYRFTLAGGEKTGLRTVLDFVAIYRTKTVACPEIRVAQ